jgi:hypothetical protein
LFDELNAHVASPQSTQAVAKNVKASEKNESSKLEFDTKSTDEPVKSDFTSILDEEEEPAKAESKVVESIGIDLENNVYLQVGFLLPQP